MQQAIEQVLQGAIDSGTIDGAVVMVGDRAGELHAVAKGRTGPGETAEMALDTIFQLASMTKAIVSVAAMQLVERGALSLDSDIGDLLPDLAAPQVIADHDSAGNPVLRPAAGPITLRHLLTHTSGLGYPFMNAVMAHAQGEVAPGSLASIKAPLLFDPGTQWEYGVNTDWVGLAVEAASGQTLGAYLAEHVFGPLGMTDTAFRLSDDQRARRVTLGLRTDDGARVPMPMEIGGGPGAEFEAGGGGLSGTAADYLRFARMILNGGELDGARILQPDTVAEMSRNQVAPLRAGKMDSIMPMLALPFDYFPDQHTGWGLGFLINPERGSDGRAPGSLAWAGIANTYFWIDPASDRTAVVLMQLLPFGDPAAIGVVRGVERAVYGLA